MGENPELKLSFGPFEATPELIVGFSDGINHTAAERADAAHAELRAHPLFVARALVPGTGKLLLSRAGEVDVNRVVHAGVDLAFRGVVRPGDAVSCLAALESIEAKETGTLVSLALEIQANGAAVCSGRTRYFARGARRREKRPEEPWLEGEATELVVGTTADQSLRYAAGSGDRFPIHTDDAFAKAVGLPGVIMHGMCTLALCADAVGKQVAEVAPEGWKALRCRFSGMVLPGSDVRVRAARVDGGVRFEARNAQGRRVIAEAELCA